MAKTDWVDDPTEQDPNAIVDAEAMNALGAEVNGKVDTTTFQEQGPSGRELAYAESFVQQAGISTDTDLTGLVIDFEVGARPVYVEADCGWMQAGSPGTYPLLHLTDASNNVLKSATYAAAVSNDVRQMRLVHRITTPGSYSMKLRAGRLAGTGNVLHGASLPEYTTSLRAVER